MARYLVTGGCGFIGSHLVETLESAGHTITIIDDLSTGKRQNVSAKTEVLVESICNPAAVGAAVDRVEGVFHLAAIASVERSREEWSATHQTNLTGFINVLEAVKRRGAGIPVVYASSAAVYGDANTSPIAESAVQRPLSAYGADKLGCELHAYAAAAVHGIATTGLRFFNVYGPRQDPKSPYSGVISVFCDRLRRGGPIDVYGEGTQARDFVYVADAVNFLMRAMNTTQEGARVFNVCTGHPTTVLELAEVIGELCHVRPKIQFRPKRAGDIRISVGAPGLAIEALSLRTQTMLRDGLVRTLRWMEPPHASAIPHSAAKVG